jgi:hypothetical protein
MAKMTNPKISEFRKRDFAYLVEHGGEFMEQTEVCAAIEGLLSLLSAVALHEGGRNVD